MGTTVTLSLISHTNVGKTTLARTLLRRDVGEVLDQAHVTDVSEAHVLIEQDDDRLVLWDTPGFGDTARLMRRLRGQQEPLAWFLRQQWDRITDRPLWCSQQGIVNIKEEADVVLYLVGAIEDPEDAGYVQLELELLSWIDRPVVLLLNQLATGGEAIVARWRRFVEAWPIVRDVLPLDAFTRGWTEESFMLEQIIPLLEGDKRRAMQSLTAAWNERNLEVFHRSCTHMARYLTRAALDLEMATSGSDSEPEERGTVRLLTDALKFSAVDKKRAMSALGLRLDDATRELMDSLIDAHGLAGASAARIEERLRDYQVKGRLPLNERSGALAGAVLSGALGGLIADVSIGFLSFGGGMVAGGILGALGGAGLGRGFRLVGGTEEPSVRWSPQFLDRLVRVVLLRYLTVAHFGRGRGEYRDAAGQTDWIVTLEEALRKHRSKLKKSWSLAERGGSSAEERVHRNLERVLEESARDVLVATHPRARRLFS